MSDIICLTHTGLPIALNEAGHQVGESEQIGDPEQPSAVAEDDLGIGRDRVGPLRRYRAKAILVDAQQQADAVPVVPLTHADELASDERVERVRHAYKTRARVRSASSSS